MTSVHQTLKKQVSRRKEVEFLQQSDVCDVQIKPTYVRPEGGDGSRALVHFPPTSAHCHLNFTTLRFFVSALRVKSGVLEGSAAVASL